MGQPLPDNAQDRGELRSDRERAVESHEYGESELVRRMLRVQARGRRPGLLWRQDRAGCGWMVAAVSSFLLALTVVALGAWWTAQAIMDGDPAGTLLRFALSAVAGVYYVVLFDTAVRQQQSRR